MPHMVQQDPDPRLTTKLTAPEAVNVGDDLGASDNEVLATAKYEVVG